MYVKIQKFDEDGRDEWHELHWLCVFICFIPIVGSLFCTAFYINYAPKDTILNKCLSAFKNWFKYTPILLLFVLGSCNNNNHDKIYPVVDKIELCLDTRDIKLYVIDSCEYIGSVAGLNAYILTHKGNCKFCKQRNQIK